MKISLLFAASAFALLVPVHSFSEHSSLRPRVLPQLAFGTIDSSQVSTPMGTEKKDEEKWTKPRLHNTAAFRSIAILGALTAVGIATPLQNAPKQALAFTHVFSFASWLGTVNYTTFVLGITMFKNLPRQTFGKLQAKLFPKYFGLSSIALVLQMATTKVLSVPQRASITALSIALGTNLLNQFILEPLSTDNMMQRYEMEAEGGKTDSAEYKKLKASFGKFHGMSSLLNLVTLCAGTTHGYYLASALV